MRARGFTLIEMLAVLMLVALVLTVASVSVSQGLSGAKVRSAGRDLVAALRYTRGQAIVGNTEQVLELDVERRTYKAPKRPEVELPKDMELKLLTAAMEQTGDSKGNIRFFPDGSSTGGRVRLIAGERQWSVEVAWLTGEVVLRQGATP